MFKMLNALGLSFHRTIGRVFCTQSEAVDMTKYTEAFARRMHMAGIKPHNRIALGVSGGPDSIALCVLTANWKKKEQEKKKEESSGYIDGLLGIVVDHKLRPESTEEAHKVSNMVSQMGIECVIAYCNWIDGKPKQGHIQEAARNMRYQLLQDFCIKNQVGVLMIAHHGDDQAELFILRLSRDSGVLGLAGMAFISQIFPSHLHSFEKNSSDNGILLVRPLLQCTKEDLYRICQMAGQEWIEDPTNESQLFARNRIRKLMTNSSSTFKYELRAVISACRETRLYVDDICNGLMDEAVSITAHGYAIIDLVALDPLKVNDLCLSRFLSLLLLFISQRIKPIQSSVSQLLLSYIRKLPCKTSLTVGGCYLCPSPGSKGTKLLVCSSPDSQLPRAEILHECFPKEHSNFSSSEIQCIIMNAKARLKCLFPDASFNVPFLHISSGSLLNHAMKLNLLSESSYKSILHLQSEEAKRFKIQAKIDLHMQTDSDPPVEDKSELQLKRKFRSARGFLSESLKPMKWCYFMNRFLISWKLCKEIIKEESSVELSAFIRNQTNRMPDDACESGIISCQTKVSVRYMVDSDWLHLLNMVKDHAQDKTIKSSVDIRACTKGCLTNCSDHVLMSVESALQILKTIPVAARRALPVLVDHQDILLCIPAIGFKRCPYLSVYSVFKPRVPLGGGYSSYL